MFKLKFANIKDPTFTTALRKLMSYNGYSDTKIAYNVAKIGRKFDEETKTCQDLYIKHIKKFAKLDEKGEFVPQTKKIKNEKGEEVDQKLPGTYVIPDENQEAFKKASEEFDATEFEIPCHLVKLVEVNGAKLSPQDLLALEPILTELEVAPNPKANGAVPAGFPKAVQQPAPTTSPA